MEIVYPLERDRNRSRVSEPLDTQSRLRAAFLLTSPGAQRLGAPIIQCQC